MTLNLVAIAQMLIDTYTRSVRLLCLGQYARKQLTTLDDLSNLCTYLLAVCRDISKKNCYTCLLPPPPHEQSQNYRVSYVYWSGFPEKSHSQASIKCWASSARQRNII